MKHFFNDPIDWLALLALIAWVAFLWFILSAFDNKPTSVNSRLTVIEKRLNIQSDACVGAK